MSTEFPYASLSDLADAIPHFPGPDSIAIENAEARNAVLTKPAGSLGRLEKLASWVAGWQGTDRPTLDHIQIAIFAGNHGVAEAGVSAFPAEVTAQMVANFEAGGAAINQLAGVIGAELSVHALSLDRPTANITEADAMSEVECLEALSIGWKAVDPSVQLLIPGEMGIGNTTIAAAIAAHLFGGTASDWIGAGTGVDSAGMQRKASAVSAALKRHHGKAGLDVLRCLGGRELAAMAGAVLAARAHRIPVLLDGFIGTAAVAPLSQISEQALAHCQASHVSVEPGHARLMDRLRLEPLINLDLRLGEGSGAAVAASILKAAVACQSGMASFAEAGVSDA